MKNNKGFTLIELLVVIAIIGLLSTLAVVSLNNARAKARDANRVSDVKQISTLIEMEAANTESGSYVDVISCGEALPDEAQNCTIGGQSVSDFADPQNTGECDGTSGCDYTITDADADEYMIEFYLEDGAGGIGAGANCVLAGGVMASGTCPAAT